MWDFEQYSQRSAVYTQDGQCIRYEQLQRYGCSLAQVIPARSLILQLSRNDLGSVIGYTCFISHRVVPVMLAADSHLSVIQTLIERYSPDFIYLPVERVQQFVGEQISECKIIVEQHGYCLVPLNKSVHFDSERVPLNDELALLLSTSGSTGSPKLVRQSYTNLASNTAAIIESINVESNDVAMTTLPMHYTYGLSVINSHLAAGASLVLTTYGLMQKQFWLQLTKYQVTTFAGVPYTYEMLARLRMERMELPHLRKLSQAGGGLSLKLQQHFAHWAANSDRQFTVMYGQTEATARMAYLPSEQSLNKLGSVGIAIPGGKFELIDETEQVITEPNRAGELVYHGDNVCLGYAMTRNDLARGDEWAGTLKTGDIGSIDSQGYLTIVGRIKRFIKLFGNRVNLDEIEALLKSRFPQVNAACIGRDDQLQVYVDEPAAVREVKCLLVKTTQINPQAFKVKIIRSIPRSASGKVLYKELEGANE